MIESNVSIGLMSYNWLKHILAIFYFYFSLPTIVIKPRRKSHTTYNIRYNSVDIFLELCVAKIKLAAGGE